MDLIQARGVTAGETGWTEGRVETLKSLWLDGLSASEVACQLGGGLTRNAVIGKLHRLGVRRGDKVALTPGRSREPARETPPPRPPPRLEARGPAKPDGRRSMRCVALAPPAEAERQVEMGLEPLGLVATVLALGARDCRWPIGDPRASDFSFCGHPADGVYCQRHSALAYVSRTPAMLQAQRKGGGQQD